MKKAKIIHIRAHHLEELLLMLSGGYKARLAAGPDFYNSEFDPKITKACADLLCSIIKNSHLRVRVTDYPDDICKKKKCITGECKAGGTFSKLDISLAKEYGLKIGKIYSARQLLGIMKSL